MTHEEIEEAVEAMNRHLPEDERISADEVRVAAEDGDVVILVTGEHLDFYRLQEGPARVARMRRTTDGQELLEVLRDGHVIRSELIVLRPRAELN
jgi:hypothetical protein